jgi:hypothetical protein
MFDTLKVAQAEKQIYPQSVGQTNGGKEMTDRNADHRFIGALGTASWCLRFVGLAAAFGEAARCAAVRWWFVRAAVESFGVPAFAEFLLWRVSAWQSCGSFLERRFCDEAWNVVVEL